MNNRDELQTEYFELIRALNKTNRTTNLRTNLSFFRKTDFDEQLFLACTVNNEFYLRITNKSKNQSWILEPAFAYQELAKYILKNTDMDSEDINSAIINSLRRIFAS